MRRSSGLMPSDRRWASSWAAWSAGAAPGCIVTITLLCPRRMARPHLPARTRASDPAPPPGGGNGSGVYGRWCTGARGDFRGCRAAGRPSRTIPAVSRPSRSGSRCGAGRMLHGVTAMARRHPARLAAVPLVLAVIAGCGGPAPTPTPHALGRRGQPVGERGHPAALRRPPGVDRLWRPLPVRHAQRAPRLRRRRAGRRAHQPYPPAGDRPRPAHRLARDQPRRARRVGRRLRAAGRHDDLPGRHPRALRHRRLRPARGGPQHAGPLRRRSGDVPLGRSGPRDHGPVDGPRRCRPGLRRPPAGRTPGPSSATSRPSPRHAIWTSCARPWATRR